MHQLVQLSYNIFNVTIDRQEYFLRNSNVLDFLLNIYIIVSSNRLCIHYLDLAHHGCYVLVQSPNAEYASAPSVQEI